MTGWRLGHAVAPREVIDGMTRTTQHSTSCVTAFAQAGALEVLSSEQSRAAKADMVRWYAVARDRMIELIAKSEDLDCSARPSGAFYVFPSYKMRWKSCDPARDLLREAHVAVVLGIAFGSCGEGHLRCPMRPRSKAVREAFRRLELFFQSRVRCPGSGS